MSASAERGGRRPEARLAHRGGGVELLRAPAALFRVVSDVRAGLYDRGWLPSERLEVPVVCVGNLSAGGTGKTPLVALVVRTLAENGLRAGILSRGYRAPAGEAGDEARMLADELPGVPHVADPDRVAGGRALVARGVDAIVLDDGFQHRRLQRDVDLVLVDALRPWGLPAPSDGSEAVCALLPRGLLRESPRALRRADALVLSRVDQVEEEARGRLERRLEELAPGVPLLHGIHRPRTLRGPDGREGDPATLADREVDLVSGIGNPEAFEATVRGLGARIRHHRRFPDHHAYLPDDLAGLGGAGRWIVTTAKDAPKLAAGEHALFVLEVEFSIVRGRPVIDALLAALPRGPRQRQRASLHEGLHG